MPGTITAALPTTRASLRLTDIQLNAIVQALDVNHDGRLAGDEVRFSLAARGRLPETGTTTADLITALRDEKVAIRQLPAAVAAQVAQMLAPSFYGMQGLPRQLDTDKNGSLSSTELATALNQGQLVLNRNLRASNGAPAREEHYTTAAALPVAAISQAMSQSQYYLIRGDGTSGLAAALGGLTAVAAAGGKAGLAANAIYQGIVALQQDLPPYGSQPGWLAMIARFGLSAIGRGETDMAGILAAAGRQILYERPDEDGARSFYTAALQSLQVQQGKDDRRWDTQLLRQLETEPSALALLRTALPPH